jgi:hypothetical protein
MNEMIRITIEIDELEEAPTVDDEAQFTSLREALSQIVERAADGELFGYVEDMDGAPCATFKVEEGLSPESARLSR